MNKFSFSKTLIFILIGLFSLHAHAQDGTKVSCQENEAIDDLEVKVFTEKKAKFKQIKDDYCNHRVIGNELKDRIADLLLDLDDVFPVSKKHKDLHRAIEKMIRDTDNFPPFNYLFLAEDRLSITMSLPNNYRVENEDFETCNQTAKTFDTGFNCEIAVQEFRSIYNIAQSLIAQPPAREVSKNLAVLEQQWTTYFQESKSQTIWELWANGKMFKHNNIKLEYAEPPSYQLVIMHPTLVVENVKDAVDGDQLKEAIMMELIGADWWGQDKWYIPSGFAVVSTYSDRAGVDDWGYGVSINFKSNLSIGATDRDGDVGFFITLDLLKIIQDKKSVFESYRGDSSF